MKPEYIKKFESLGLGIFVHFGLYSLIGKGEWHYWSGKDVNRDEYLQLPLRFNPNKNWAKDIVKTAKNAGAKYVVLTTRHHDGFSLFDTRGLNDFDAPHSACKRDLVKEFVEACNSQHIVPFFYHTLLDWHHPNFFGDFEDYIDYLNASVELLCKNYGKIGGLWFDGYWSKPDANWQFDRLYKMIRKYQPEAMIINNTGINDLGEVTHYEIDAVTFERGKPVRLSSADGKERTGEMCDGITDHWGYSKFDVSYKSVKELLNSLIDCRKYGCNYLINSGPTGNGIFNPIEKYTLLEMGKWIKQNKYCIYNISPSEVEAENAVVVKDDKYHYAIIKDVPMAANENVARRQNRPKVVLKTDKKISNLVWMDTKEKVNFDKKTCSFDIKPYDYGFSMYAKVVRFKVK